MIKPPLYKKASETTREGDSFGARELGMRDSRGSLPKAPNTQTDFGSYKGGFSGGLGGTMSSPNYGGADGSGEEGYEKRSRRLGAQIPAATFEMSTKGYIDRKKKAVDEEFKKFT